MLVIFEGLDMSGKTFYAKILKKMYANSVLIKRMHEPELYPIDYNEGSKYDWQAMFDRIILANPDTMFIADRSFFTHVIYQTCLVKDNPVKDEHINAFNRYCKVLVKIPHLVVYTESQKYELDSMICNRTLRDNISSLYWKIFHNIAGLNFLPILTDRCSIFEVVKTLQDSIDNIIHSQHESINQVSI